MNAHRPVAWSVRAPTGGFSLGGRPSRRLSRKDYNGSGIIVVTSAGQLTLQDDAATAAPMCGSSLYDAYRLLRRMI